MSRKEAGKKAESIAYIVSIGAGLEAFIYREIEALYECGLPVVLFATKFSAGDVFSPKPDWPYHTLSPRQLILHSPLLILKMLLRPGLLLEALSDGGLVDLVFATRFSAIMKHTGVRQIHCHFGDHKFFIGYYCKRLTGLPLSVTIHAHEFYTNPNPGLFRKALAETDRIFPIASRWRGRLIKDFGVPESRISLNRLFVDTDLYKPSNEVSVLSVGRFTERKGFRYLLEAARELTDLNVRFIFVGFGELDLRKMANDLGVGKKVTVFGKMDQEQLRVMFQAADILCVPSITTEREGAEGIPVVLMEGMACGLPVVATRCGAIDEIVDDYLVDERSASQIADVIRRLASDRELMRQQGEKNRKIIKSHYSSSNLEKFCGGLNEIAAEEVNSD